MFSDLYFFFLCSKLILFFYIDKYFLQIAECQRATLVRGRVGRTRQIESGVCKSPFPEDL